MERNFWITSPFSAQPMLAENKQKKSLSQSEWWRFRSPADFFKPHPRLTLIQKLDFSRKLILLSESIPHQENFQVSMKKTWLYLHGSKSSVIYPEAVLAVTTKTFCRFFSVKWKIPCVSCYHLWGHVNVNVQPRGREKQILLSLSN